MADGQVWGQQEVLECQGMSGADQSGPTLPQSGSLPVWLCAHSALLHLRTCGRVFSAVTSISFAATGGDRHRQSRHGPFLPL